MVPGPDGIIGLRELAAVAPAAPAAPAHKGIDLDEMRKAIGAAMARSKREIPHYYVTSAIDLSAMMNWLSRENEGRPVASRLLPLAPIMKACALALSKVRELNGRYVDDRFVPSSTVKMGVGIALRGGGLIAPAIDSVETLDLGGIMARLGDLTARTRGGRLRSSELMEASVTLSSLGENSADTLLPIIYPPQVAIIGVGSIADRPWPVDGGVGLRKTASFTVAGDHRVSDGRSAARFILLIQSLLDKPEEL
jgi:pyruvate dehydrogenase E2 component (dihydrolipoamide acetyltransferase)